MGELGVVGNCVVLILRQIRKSSSSSSWLPVMVELFKCLLQRVCGCVVFILIGCLCSSGKKKRIEHWLKGGRLFYF